MPNLFRKILDYDKLAKALDDANNTVKKVTSLKNTQETIFKNRIKKLEKSNTEKDLKIEKLIIKIHEAEEKINHGQIQIKKFEVALDKKEALRRKAAGQAGGYKKQINKLEKKLVYQKLEFNLEKEKLLKIIEEQEKEIRKYRFLKSKLEEPAKE